VYTRDGPRLGFVNELKKCKMMKKLTLCDFSYVD
jgi:hypothetical protein